MTEPALISTGQLISHLDQLISLPGSPGHPEDMATVANRIAALMRSYGLHVDMLSNGQAPLVIGRRAGREPFTLMLYHHYDVAPPGAWRLWHHDPFQMAELESTLYGRGVADGKGPLVAHLNALAALIEAEGELPCGVVVVAEGEALMGSPSLATALAEHPELFKADACLATGGDRDPSGKPFCYSGSKGLLQVRLRTNSAGHAIPSGYATTVPNPLWRMLWALTQIKSDQEEILINGFYDSIDGPSRSESQAIRNAEFDEAGRLAAWGIGQFMFGMSGGAIVQAEVTLPTCNITAVTVEPVGELALIPTGASARLDFQLVPLQKPDEINTLLIEHLEAKGLTDVRVERLPGGYAPTHTAIDNQFICTVSDIGRHIYGSPLATLPYGAFAQPLDLFNKAFTIPTAVVGCARPDSAIFAPNEHISLPDLVRHGQLLIELLYACATLKPQ